MSQPTIKEALELLSQGFDLHHDDRFRVAMSLIESGKTDKEIVDVFHKVPDFDESMTYKQLVMLREYYHNAKEILEGGKP